MTKMSILQVLYQSICSGVEAERHFVVLQRGFEGKSPSVCVYCCLFLAAHLPPLRVFHCIAASTAVKERALERVFRECGGLNRCSVMCCLEEGHSRTLE